MSAPYDFLNIYMPTESELDAERMKVMRGAAALLVRSVYPDVETAPNSPFGDLMVAPAAPLMTAWEEMGNRLLSDMDPENVEKGVAYNCDWLRQFFLNFGIQDETYQRSYGIVRLYFSSSEARDIDRSTEFRIGDGVYRPFVPQAGPLLLLPPGTPATPGTNSRNYVSFDTSNFVVDILAFGNAGQQASAGAAVAVDRTIDGLVGAVALSPFLGGTSPPQLQELARRVRHNFFSRTPTTRGGATNLIHQQFPEITITGCTISGDFEQVRDVTNPAQVAAGKIDIMARSATLLQDTVTVRLRQMPTADGLVYSGWLDLPETPVQLLSFVNTGSYLEPDVFSISTDAATPGLSAAYGASERLLVSIPYQVDSGGEPVIKAEVDDDGVYADITVNYLFDPYLKICQEFLHSDENTPAGVDIYVRWFVPIVVSELLVNYTRKAGGSFNLAYARNEILQAYNSHNYENPAGPALIDAALYYAGAHSVNSVALTAEVRYSVASKVWLGTDLVPPTDEATWTAFLSQCQDVPTREVYSAYAPDIFFADISNDTFAVSGERNVSYLLKSSALKLVEQRSI